jgi:long-chain fatty acid transport protein
MTTRYDIAFSVFSPSRQYTVVGNPSGYPGTFGLTPGTVKSGSKVFFIPSVGANWKLDNESAFNVSIFGNGGMNTDYNTSTFYGTTPTGVDLSQLFMSATYARQLNKDHSLGITATLAYQRFAAKGLQAFAGFSSDPTKLSNEGYYNGFGYGARFGYLGNLFPELSVGASFQTKTYMEKFDNYEGLFAEQGGFNIPANWTAGLAYKANGNLVLLFDVQQILYSGIKSVHNAFNPSNFQNGILLGQDNGSGFGWKDMTIYKFGMQWLKGEGWTWRAGYSYGKQPIPSSEVLFNILAPGVIEQHATFGFTKALANGHEISFAAMYAFPKEVKGTNPMEAPNQQTIKLKMHQFDFEIGYSF